MTWVLVFLAGYVIGGGCLGAAFLKNKLFQKGEQ